MTQPDALLTADEVAEVARTSSETVRRWARQGKLPSIELPSGRLRFRREDVDEMLAPTDQPDGP